MSSITRDDVQWVADRYSDVDHPAGRAFDLLVDVADHYCKLVEEELARYITMDDPSSFGIKIGLGEPIDITVEGIRENLKIIRGEYT